MILLDTNILSELLKPTPAPQVLAWFGAQEAQPLTITAITVAELAFGVAAMPMGKRQQRLEFEIAAMLAKHFEDCVLPFDQTAAEFYGVLAARLKRQGVVVGQSDMMIAAIALQHNAMIATRNIRHFAPCGVKVFNPF